MCTASNAGASLRSGTPCPRRPDEIGQNGTFGPISVACTSSEPPNLMV